MPSTTTAAVPVPRSTQAYKQETALSVSQKIQKKNRAAKQAAKRSKLVDPQDVLSTLCSPLWVRDLSLPVPNEAPRNIPLVRTRINTHQGRQILLCSGDCEVVDGKLWLGAAVPQDPELCKQLAQYILKNIQTKLQQLRPSRINAGFIKQMDHSSPHLVCVVVMQ